MLPSAAVWKLARTLPFAQLRAQGYKAFYLAIGCQGGRTAGVPGEDAAGIQTAVALLRTVGGDESHKMTGKTVVIGGGNVAIDAARVALRCGSSDVTMVCLEPREKMSASAEEIAEAEEEGTAIRCGYGPKEFFDKGRPCVRRGAEKDAPACTMPRAALPPPMMKA